MRIDNIFPVTSLRFLTRAQGQKAITALRAMKACMARAVPVEAIERAAVSQIASLRRLKAKPLRAP